MSDRKIIEITVTDERGETHTLRCPNGLEIRVENGISAITKSTSNVLALHVGQGRWIAYRLCYAD